LTEGKLLLSRLGANIILFIKEKDTIMNCTPKVRQKTLGVFLWKKSNEKI
jgi:hypothetical protein